MVMLASYESSQHCTCAGVVTCFMFTVGISISPSVQRVEVVMNLHDPGLL